VISQGNVDTGISQKQLNNRYLPRETAQQKGGAPKFVPQVDIDDRVCQKQFDNFNMAIIRGDVKGGRADLVVFPIHIEIWLVPQERLDFFKKATLCCINQMLFHDKEGRKEGRKGRKEGALKIFDYSSVF